MFSRIFKILRESISSVTNANQWEMITKDMLKQGITGYKPPDPKIRYESCPKYCEGQLVKIRYHPKWKHLHDEIGIILDVCHYDSTKVGSNEVYFYEVLVKEQKITIIERYLDGVICTEEKSD